MKVRPRSIARGGTLSPSKITRVMIGGVFLYTPVPLAIRSIGTFAARAQSRMKGFRALRFSSAELVAAVQERLSRPLERTEVWYLLPST